MYIRNNKNFNFSLFVSKYCAESENNEFNEKKPINENRYWVPFNKNIILVRTKFGSHDAQPVNIKWQNLNSYEYLAKYVII